MKIGVLVKSVPNSESSLKVDGSKTWVEEEGVNFELNESDSYALEEALLIKEKQGGDSEVVVISMGPDDRGPKVIRECLAKGGDRGIHISETDHFVKDPLATSEIFSKAMVDEKFDLVLSGLQTEDQGHGQTGVLLGEMLGMSTATLAMALEIQDAGLRIKRELEAGWFQWITLPFPASVTIQSGINTPRYPSLRGIMGAKKKEIKTIQKSDLGVSGEALQSVRTLFTPQKDKQTIMIDGDVGQIVDKLVDVLKTEIKIL